jgi:hypothetical protein
VKQGRDGMSNSIRIRDLRVAGFCLSVVAGAWSVSTAASGPAKYKPPRTEFGHPDLQGVWNYSSDIPTERPKEFADKEFLSRADAEKLRSDKAKQFDQFASIGVGAHSTSFFDFAAQTENLRTSLVVYPADGRIPKRLDGVPHFNGSDGVFSDAKGSYPVRLIVGGIGKDGPEQRGLFERCLTINAIPFNPGIENNYTQIVQNKDYVILLIEQIHDARIVPLDGRPFVLDKMRSWLGESRGHFEGDTLVVVTKNFTDLTASFNGSGTSFDKVVTERFTRTSVTTLKYEATIDDAKTFQDKIVISFPMVKTDARLFEFACHEGNYDMTTILSGARKQELDALEAKK